MARSRAASNTRRRARSAACASFTCRHCRFTMASCSCVCGACASLAISSDTSPRARPSCRPSARHFVHAEQVCEQHHSTPHHTTPHHTTPHHINYKTTTHTHANVLAGCWCCWHRRSPSTIAAAATAADPLPSPPLVDVSPLNTLMAWLCLATRWWDVSCTPQPSHTTNQTKLTHSHKPCMLGTVEVSRRTLGIA